MGILLAYLLLITSAIPKSIKRIAEERKTNNQAIKTQPSADLKRIGAEITLSKEEAQRYYADQNKSYSLQRLIFLVNLFTLVGLVFYTIFTYRILCASKKSADAAKESADTAASQLEMAERPWISGPITVTGPFVIGTAVGAHLSVTFDMKNIGQSPASNVVKRAMLTTGEYGSGQDTISERKHLCDNLTNSILNSDGQFWFPETIFPNTETPEEDGTILSDPATQYFQKHSDETYPTYRIVTCVAYMSTFNNDVAYYTGRIYGIEPSDSKNRIRVGETIPAKGIQLREWGKAIVGKVSRSK